MFTMPQYATDTHMGPLDEFPRPPAPILPGGMSRMYAMGTYEGPPIEGSPLPPLPPGPFSTYHGGPIAPIMLVGWGR